MKKIFYIFLFCACFIPAYSQSPYYSISFSAEGGPQDAFTIHVQSCDFNYTPVINSGDYWFGRDTSVLEWNSLPDSMYSKLKCGEVNTVNGKKYDDSNQSMVWERIYRFTVIRNNADTMTIVFPVLRKSFVTHISLGKVQFQPGYFEITNDIEYTYGQWLSLSLPAGYVWKETAFEDRKIKITK